MTPWFLIAATVLYAFEVAHQAMLGHNTQAVMLAGYIIANLGVILSVYNV